MITYILRKKKLIITGRQKEEEKEEEGKNTVKYIHIHIFNNLSV